MRISFLFARCRPTQSRSGALQVRALLFSPLLLLLLLRWPIYCLKIIIN